MALSTHGLRLPMSHTMKPHRGDLIEMHAGEGEHGVRAGWEAGRGIDRASIQRGRAREAGHDAGVFAGVECRVTTLCLDLAYESVAGLEGARRCPAASRTGRRTRSQAEAAHVRQPSALPLS